MVRDAAAIVRSSVLPIAQSASRELRQTKGVSDVDQALSMLEQIVRWRLVRIASDMVARILDQEVARHTRRFIQSVKAAIGIDLATVIAKEDLVDEFAMIARRNAALIANLGEDIVRRVGQAVSEAVIRGESSKKLALRLTEEFGFVSKRARLIARDQSAKLTGDLNRLRQQQAGVSEYNWLTSRDERVRQSHKVMEGKNCQWGDASVFRADDASEWQSRGSIGGVSLHPGQDIQCRCVARGLIRF